MTLQEVTYAAGRERGDVRTAPHPARKTAAQRLSTRVLVIAKGEADETAPHVDPERSGLVIAGATPLRRLAVIKRNLPNLTVMVEPSSVEDWATAEHPFSLDTDGLFPVRLSDVLDEQIRAGADVAVTPTRVFRAVDSDAMKTALLEVNNLDRDDVLFLLPVHHRWLSNDNIKQFIAVISRSRHPVAVALADSRANPMSHSGVVANYRRLFEEAPWAMPWRADLAAFDALAHGAGAAAVGQIPSLRRIAFPGEQGYSSDKRDMSPHVLLRRLLRYRRTSKMQTEWFASKPADACQCAHCNGQGIDRFDSSNEQRLSAHLHNLHEVTAMREELDGLATADIALWWQRQLIDVEYECQALKGRIGVDVKVTADVRAWSAGPRVQHPAPSTT